MARRRTPTLDVADELLRAAHELLAAGGAAALSIREIASRAGVAPMGVYKRFGSKDGILDALLIRGFDELASVVAPRFDVVPGEVGGGVPAGEWGPQLAQIAVGLERYRQFALANPSMYALMFDRTVPDHCPSEASMVSARNAFDHLVSGVRLGIAAGKIAPGDPVEIAQRLWAGCHGAVSLELRGVTFVSDVETHYEHLIATLLRGIATAPT